MRMWSNFNIHSLPVGMQNRTATLQNSLADCYKVKCTFTTPASKSSYILKSNKNLYIPKDSYLHIHGTLFLMVEN